MGPHLAHLEDLGSALLLDSLLPHRSHRDSADQFKLSLYMTSGPWAAPFPLRDELESGLGKVILLSLSKIGH